MRTGDEGRNREGCISLEYARCVVGSPGQHHRRATWRFCYSCNVRGDDCDVPGFLPLPVLAEESVSQRPRAPWKAVFISRPDCEKNNRWPICVSTCCSLGAQAVAANTDASVTFTAGESCTALSL